MDLELVDGPRVQVLADHVGAAGDRNIPVAGCRARLVEGGVDPVDEVEVVLPSRMKTNPRTGRRRGSSGTRASIAAAAREAFADAGYERATIRAIADRAA